MQTFFIVLYVQTIMLL